MLWITERNTDSDKTFTHQIKAFPTRVKHLSDASEEQVVLANDTPGPFLKPTLEGWLLEWITWDVSTVADSPRFFRFFI
jgi:hypothetical protein